MADWNQDQDVALLFKGFAQIYDGGTPYRFKKLQQLIINSQADSSKSYNDVGLKRKPLIGDSSSVEMRSKKTADLFDTAATPADQKTLSWLIYKVNVLRENPEIDFEYITETEASSDKFVHGRVIFYGENIREERNPSDGEYEIVISGEIKTWTTPGQRTPT